MRIASISSLPLSALVIALAVGLGGCGLIEEQDGLTPEDFRHDTATQEPEQNAPAAQDKSQAAITAVDVLEPAPGVARDDAEADAKADLARALDPAPRYAR